MFVINAFGSERISLSTRRCLCFVAFIQFYIIIQFVNYSSVGKNKIKQFVSLLKV